MKTGAGSEAPAESDAILNTRRRRTSRRRRRRAVRQRIMLGTFFAIMIILIGGVGFGIRSQWKRKEKTALLQSGIVCMEQENYEAAIGYFDQELNAAGNRIGSLEEEVLLYRAEVEFLLEDYQAALHTYQILLKKDKKNELYQKGTALALMETGSYEEALAMHVIDAQVYNRMAKAQIEQGAYDAALNFIEQGFAALGTDNMDHGYVRRDLAYNEAVVYEYKSDYQKALELFEDYIQTYGPDENAEREIVFLKTRQGNY